METPTRLDGHPLLTALAICGVSATLALAVLPPPYDFSGHWTGTAQREDRPAVPLSADFAPTTNARKFTGTSTLGDPLGSHITCTLKAKYRSKLKLRLDCDDGSKPKLRAQLDATTQTLTGSFPIVGRHGKRHTETFTLTKTSA